MVTFEIDYVVLMYMVMGLFGLVGFFRGWWKEGVTTFLLTLLVILLKVPEAAQAIIDTINKLIKLIYIIIVAHSLEAERIAEVAKEIKQAPIVLNASDNHIYIITLIVLIILSYMVGKIGMGKDVTGVHPLGALLGGILGLFNGFVVISLVREYLVRRYLPGITPQDVPMEIQSAAIRVNDIHVSVMDGPTPWLIIAFGMLIALALVFTRISIQKTKVKTKPPPLYKTPPPKKPSGGQKVGEVIIKTG